MSLDSVRPWRQISRRKSREISVGNVKIGGGNPISVQTMTNTITADAKQTIAQVKNCAEAGAEIVRVSCPDTDSTMALKEICKRTDIDLIYVCTHWDLHTPIAVYAMENNKHVAVEVPAALTVKECWNLVKTSEKTRKHCKRKKVIR